MSFFRDNMKYIEFNLKNPRCIHCYISERAYASVITEVMTNGQNETGGVFLGYIVNRAWYIVESVDPGIATVNQVAFFQWDTDYVNHQAKRLGKIYNKPLTILGFWHRHPGSMDYFSGQDETTIRSNLRELRAGLLSMLINIDPKLRMTFYYCYDNEIMPIRYDVGDKYFPTELLKYADANELSRRASESGRNLEIHYEQVINLEAIAAKKRNSNGLTSAVEKKVEVTAHRQASTEGVKIPIAQERSSEYVSNETIKRIVEVVIGTEGKSKEQGEILEKRINKIESTLADISEKINLLYKKQEGENLHTTVHEVDEEMINKVIVSTVQALTAIQSHHTDIESPIGDQNTVVDEEALDVDGSSGEQFEGHENCEETSKERLDDVSGTEGEE